MMKEEEHVSAGRPDPPCDEVKAEEETLQVG